MNLIQVLERDYGKNTPIIQKNLDYGLTSAALRMRMKRLADQGKLNRYTEGIYYIPEKSRIGLKKLSTDAVIRNKYISDGNSVYGFYTGLKLLNELGLTTQVPNTVEIVSNMIKSKRIDKTLGKRSVILRRPMIPISVDNVNILKLIELLKCEQFIVLSISEKKQVLKKIGIDKKSLLQLSSIASNLPLKVSQEILKSEVLYAIAS